MAKNAITDFSTTAASNTDVGGTDIQGTAPASNMDNATRELMSQLADTNAGTAPWADTMTIGDAADLTKEVRFELSGITTATTRVLTVPNYDGTIATLAGTETLTNKTLTAPAIANVVFPASQSASADANTLDDYEEGSSTPTVAASSGTITSYTSSLQYTKIGNRVTFTVVIFISDAGTGAGALNVSMPFTASSVIVAAGAHISSNLSVIATGASAGTNLAITYYNSNSVIATGVTVYLFGTFKV